MNIENYIQNYKTYLLRLGYAQSTIKHNGNSLNQFLAHLKQQNVKEIKEIKPNHIIAYNEYLHGLKSRITNIGLNGSTIQDKINVIRLFSKFLEATEKIKILTVKVDIIPSIKSHKEILSQQEIKQLYEQTDDSITGLRDRALLGLYYGCGLRYKEGISVELNHIDYKKEIVFIAPSKNYYSRYVPVNNNVLKDFRDYEKYSRKHFDTKENYFLSGGRSNGYLNKLLHNLCEKAKIKNKLCLHSLRHSIATHLLQKEMPLEQIAKFLGHRTMMATQVYTHIVEELRHQ